MSGKGNLAPPWKPGQSGNPGGKSKEQKRLEIENAERATRIRAGILAKIEAALDPETGTFTGDLTADLNTFIRDTENRGLGSPKAVSEISGPDGGPVLQRIERVIVDPQD
jgi:hypothetical protein